MAVVNPLILVLALHKRRWLSHQKRPRLLVERWKHIHVLAASVVAFLFRICNRLSKSSREGIFVGAVDTQPLIVLMEIVYPHDLSKFIEKL